MQASEPELPDENAADHSVRPVPEDSSYIPTLDGWRAIAVGLVIGSHCAPSIQALRLPGAHALAGLLNHAGYGVDIFFTLSGFLITTLLLREQARTGRVSLKSFYVRRVFRILPPIIAFLAVAFALGLLSGPYDLIPPLFFFRNYADGPWYTGHFWSLSVEEHFYAVIPLLIYLLSPRALLRTYIGLGITCIVIRAYEVSHVASFQPLPQFRTENRVDGLLWGALLAQLYHLPTMRGRLEAMLASRWTAFVLLAGAALLFATDWQALHRTVVALILPPILVWTVTNPTSIVGRILEHPALKWFGRLSYSLYVWQMMFLTAQPGPLQVAQTFPISIAFAITSAYLSYRFVEQPARIVGHHVASRLNRHPSLRASRLAPNSA